LGWSWRPEGLRSGSSTAAAIWREREGAGEGEIDQNVTKNQRWRYLWARGSTAVLRVASATRIVLGEGKFAGGSGELRAAVVQREEGGARLGLYRPAVRREKEGERAGLVTCHVRVTAVAFHPSSADGGRRKERTGEEKGSSGKKKGKKKGR